MSHSRLFRGVVLGAVVFGSIFFRSDGPRAAADLWIRDDAADSGAEPNSSSTILYLSDDIWVRRLPDPNYDPLPFPCASPTWTPLPHEGPCYRDPKTGSPNYLYVRVRNRGNMTSSGTETLHVYWAKAATGLSWPTDWNDHLASPCPGPARLYGYEVTKPRRNAVSVSPTERNDYVAAIQMIDTAAFQFPDLMTYFDKQNQVHSTLFSTGIHTSLRFLPWHREFVNRYEALLREVKPELTLLYWDWTTDPSPTIIGPTGFMGASSGAVGAPFASFGISRSKFAGVPSAFAGGLSAGYQSGTLLASGSYSSFWTNMEGPSHNQAHNYISGTLASLNAARDPVFFMLHANCDRLWALWQRQNVTRWAPATAYDASQANVAITSSMRPWNGTDAISPWINTIPGDPNGYAIQKPPTHHSIVYPPTYDDALLRIPPIPANSCAIIEIPFYPPRASECNTFSDPQHLCLLARIEPITTSPPEGAALWTNVQNHNNIAWRNVTVSDCNIGPFFLVAPGRIGAAGEVIRNIRRSPTRVTLRFEEAEVAFRSLFRFGTVRLRLEESLLQAWERGGRQSTGIEFDGEELQVFGPGATLEGLELDAREFGRMDLALELRPGYEHPAGDVFYLDVLQYDEEGGPETPVGGQRYELDFNVLPIVPKGSEWAYLDGDVEPPAREWTRFEFDDADWSHGAAPFGYAGADVATRLRGDGRRPTTCYFRREFVVPDPGFFRSLALSLPVDDGVAVYLNGEEVYRANLPEGDLDHFTPARSPVAGAAAQACRPVDLSNWLGALQRGRNVLAVELHAASRDQRSLDIHFDLEFAANVPDVPREPPVVQILTPPDGALVSVREDIDILADVLDADGNLADVRVFFDGELVGRGTVPPHAARVPAQRPGRHRVSVEAIDETQRTTRMESVFTVVENLPPSVEITVPDNSMFHAGEPVVLTAEASDVDGTVAEVRFFIANITASHFPDPTSIREVGVDTSSPYSVSVPGLPPGPYFAFVEATDDGGAVGYSTRLPHIHVHGVNPRPVRPGDCNGDGRIDIADAICMFQVLFVGQTRPLPCGDGLPRDAGNVRLLDWQGDRSFDISDGIGVLQHLFAGRPGHVLGPNCRMIEGCDGSVCPQ